MSEGIDYLTNLWMRPSTDLMIAMTSKRPTILQRDVDAQSSANILQQLEARRRQRYGGDSDTPSSQQSSCSTLECDDSDAVPLAQDTFSMRSQDQSFETVDSPDEMLDSLKRRLKTIYKERMTAGAEQLINWSLANLENNLFEMVQSIRKREKDLIDQQLQPLVDFVNNYVEEVNAENGEKLTEKYRVKRLFNSVRVINNAEDSFGFAMEQAEKHIKQSYQFKTMEIKSYLNEEYLMKLKVDLDKIKNSFQLEKDSIIADYNERIEAVRTKYGDLELELSRLEETMIKERVERVVQARQIAQQQEKLLKLKAMEDACCEEAGWLYVLDQLIKDVDQFTMSFGHTEFLAKLKRKLALDKEPKRISEKYPPSLKPTRSELESTSTLSISCPSISDSEIHRILLIEARAVLETILNYMPYHKAMKRKKIIFNYDFEILPEEEEIFEI